MLLGVALVVLAAAWLLLVYPVFVRDLPDQFTYDRSLAGPDLVEFEHVDVVVLDAQPLRWHTCNFTDCYGLHLLVIPKDLPDDERLDVVLPPGGPGSSVRRGGPGVDQVLEVWFTASVEPRIPVEFIAVSGGDPPLEQETRPIETITLDLAALGYPSDIWEP